MKKPFVLVFLVGVPLVASTTPLLERFEVSRSVEGEPHLGNPVNVMIFLGFYCSETQRYLQRCKQHLLIEIFRSQTLTRAGAGLARLTAHSKNQKQGLPRGRSP